MLRKQEHQRIAVGHDSHETRIACLFARCRCGAARADTVASPAAAAADDTAALLQLLLLL